METFNLEVITPNGLIFEGPVQEATLPGEMGEFGVLPKHASLTTLLIAGVVEFHKENGDQESVVVNWGLCQVSEEKVTVLVDGAVAIRGENESEVAKALEKAKDMIQGVSDSSGAIATVSAKIESAAQKLI